MSQSGGLTRDANDPGANPGVVDVSISSGNVANAPATATLAAAAGKTTYITGFTITGAGATAAGIVAATITGTTNTLTYIVGVVAGAQAPNPTVAVSFARPIPASAPNTAIVVTVPAYGAGNVASCVTATGYQSN